MMGEGILEFYREKIKRTWKLAFYSAFFIGLLVHFYKFTNLLPNSDALYNFYSSQNMVMSGRWFLSIACSLSSYFDLPWINGLLSLVFIGVTAAVIAEIFRMENPVLIVLSSSLLVSFPTIWATMAYEFTADGYMIAMALAAVSVCLTRMEWIGKIHWRKSLLSAVCLCLSCGIYQAYVSFAFVLAVCYFMVELLENRWDNQTYWRWIGTQVLIYVLALASYYGVWKLCLHVQGVKAGSYHGIDEVGFLNAAAMKRAVVRVISEFILFFVEWNFFVYGFTTYSVLNILFLLAFAAGVAAAIWKSGCAKRKMHLVLLALCMVSIPFGCFMWYFTSPKVTYHMVMLQSVCALYIFLAVVYDRWIRGRASNLVLTLLASIVFNNAVTANISYNYMQQSVEKTNAAAAEVSTRIHMLDDGKVKYIALCGKLDNWKLEEMPDKETLRQLGGWVPMHKTLLNPLYLSLYTDFDLAYYRINDLEYPLVENQEGIPAPADWEFRFPLLSAGRASSLYESEAVRNMPIWPAEGSVRRIGDTIVVKLSEYVPEETN